MGFLVRQKLTEAKPDVKRFEALSLSFFDHADDIFSPSENKTVFFKKVFSHFKQPEVFP